MATVGSLPFRLAVRSLGSGLVLAGCRAGPGHRRPAVRPLSELPRGPRALLLLALAVNVHRRPATAAGTATVYLLGQRHLLGPPAPCWRASSLDLRPRSGWCSTSVITQEYNYLLAWPISLVMRLLGTGRYVYLLATVNLYVLPALWGLLALGRRTRWGGVLLCCATPMLLYTALVGFVDVAAAGAAIWAFVIYTDRSRPQGARGILAGALLVLVFLLRRYFFFFTVSFGLAAFAALAADRKQWKSFAALVGTGVVCSLYLRTELRGGAGAVAPTTSTPIPPMTRAAGWMR